MKIGSLMWIETPTLGCVQGKIVNIAKGAWGIWDIDWTAETWVSSVPH
jgi:hypothetical protein